jgi:hypothetical protein
METLRIDKSEVRIFGEGVLADEDAHDVGGGPGELIVVPL